MTITATLKTGALALALILGTTAASFAAQFVYVEHNVKVKQHHSQNSASVNWAEEGQKVKILASWGNWYKIQVPGPDGWVKASVLDFGYNDPLPNNGNGGSFCVKGDNASFCINTSF